MGQSEARRGRTLFSETGGNVAMGDWRELSGEGLGVLTDWSQRRNWSKKKGVLCRKHQGPSYAWTLIASLQELCCSSVVLGNLDVG